MRKATMNKTILALLMAVSVTTAVFGAGNVSPEQLGCQDAREILAAGGNLELGHWYIDWTSCKKWCDEHDVPMLAVWSNRGCFHCYCLGLCFLTEKFKDWAATHDAGKVIYCYMNGGVTGYPDQEHSAGYNWAWKVPSSLNMYPFVSIYWRGHGTVQQQGVILHKTGDQFRRDKKGAQPANFFGVNQEPSVDNIAYWMETTLADWSPLHEKDNPIDLPISYGLCEKKSYNLMEGTNWFRIAASADVKYAVRLLTDDAKYADFHYSLVSDDLNAKEVSADLGLGLEFMNDKDGSVLFGVESVRSGGADRGSVRIEVQYVAMEPDTATCFPEVSMQYSSSCGCDMPRECDYKGWNIVPDGALVTGTATVGKVMWADTDRELDYPSDVLKSPVEVNSKKTIWMQACASGYVRSEKVCASFALGKCSAPTVSSEYVSGDYGPQRVYLSTVTEGAVIRYEIGKDRTVTEDSPLYNGYFVVEESAYVNARAFKTDWEESEGKTFFLDDNRTDVSSLWVEAAEYYFDNGKLRARVNVNDGEKALVPEECTVELSDVQWDGHNCHWFVATVHGFGRYKGVGEFAIDLPDSRGMALQYAEADGGVWFYADNCDGLTIISGPVDTDGVLTAPSTIKGRAVTAIAAEAFCWREDLWDVVLPSSVCKIGWAAFEGTPYWDNLWGDSVPEGKIITIGNVVVGVKGELSVNANPDVLCSKDGTSACSVEGFNILKIPEGTSGIAQSAFEGQGVIATVELPSSLKWIGSCAFCNCSSLVQVNVPDSVFDIGENAFVGTSFWEGLISRLPDGRPICLGRVLVGFKGAAYGSGSLTVPSGILGIGEGAFRGQDGLRSIVLSEGLKAIGGCAFDSCGSLSSVALPASVTDVSVDAFCGSSIETVYVADSDSSERVRNMLGDVYANSLVQFIGKKNEVDVRAAECSSCGWTEDNGTFTTGILNANEVCNSVILPLTCNGRGTLRFRWMIRDSAENQSANIEIYDEFSDNFRVCKNEGLVTTLDEVGEWGVAGTEIELYGQGVHRVALVFRSETLAEEETCRVEIKDVEWVPASDGLGVRVVLDACGGTLEGPAEVYPGITYGELPKPVRIGFAFLGWTDQDLAEITDPYEAHFVQEGDSTPLVSEVTLHALWERYEPNAHEGEWRLTDDGFYCVVDPTEMFYDEWSGQYYPEGRRVACSYETPGRGWISFKWRVVGAEDTAKELYAESTTGWSAYSEGQRLILRTDSYMDSEAEMYELLDIEDALLYYTKGWKTERVAVANGDPMEYIWEFQNNRNESVVIQITDVTWEWAPADTQIIVTLDPCGGTLADGNQIVCGSIYEGLPTPKREGAEFIGWTAEDYYDPYFCTIVGDGDWTPLVDSVTLRAVWDVPVEIALDPYYTIQDDERGNRLEIGGMDDYHVSAQWNMVIDEDEDGKPVWETMRQVWAGERVNWQGQLTMGEERDIVRAYVHGCGIYHFSRLSCWNDGVACRVYVDGVLQDLDSEFEFNEYFSNGPGVDVEIREKPGYFARCDGLTPEDEDYDLHEIRVAVLFKGSESSCGYEVECWTGGNIGPMRWTASPASLEVTFDGCGGIVSGGSVRTFEVGSMYGMLPDVERKDFEFLGWFTKPDGGEQVLPFELVRLSATKLYARWKTDLMTALSDGKLRYATRNEDWVGTADLSHGSNGVCATTGELMWGETKVMTTVVQGHGLLSFWWMQGEDLSVSYDASLTLWLDGKQIAECHGNSVWNHMTLPVIGKGNHKVEWKYTPGTKGVVTIDDGWDYYGYLTPMLAWQAQGRIWSIFENGPVYAPGAWVDEVGWTPGSEVKSIIPWARGIVEGRGWLTEQLPLIEAEYTAKIADEPLNYEWRVLRAITKLFGLGENENLKAVLAQFGLAPDYQVLGNFFGELDYFDAPLSNEIVDALAAEAVPVLESALADLDAIPSDWTGSIPLNPVVYPVDVVTYVDLADITFYKAALKGALSALAIAEGYDLSVDYMNGEMEEILAEAGLPVTFEYLVEDHPEFAKRVRDAERLGEGKEILRDALETLQVFDGLMLARTTSEMHFFEYDEKDADKQQYAREEVAKMLVALDGETVISNDDFRYVRNFTVSEMNQPATLVPFFSGNVTRRYLPTEIHDNHPVFDSFPTMSFGGTFPGLTKDTIAGWLAESGREVEYTPNSDYEPEVQFRTFNAAIPNLGASATEEEIEDALAGTADAKVKANITDAKSYAAYETWATKVQSAGVPLKAVKASPCLWQSFALAAPELMQGEITDEDLKVEEFKPSSESGKFDFTVSVKDVTVGSEAVEENLKQVIGLEGAESLGEVFKSENVAIKFGQPEDGKLKFTAEPKNAEAKSFFMKMKVK